MKVFLSHSDADELLARQIAASLAQAGIEVLNAGREILPGDNWHEKVAQALRESDAMVILVTPESLRSTTVQRDLEYALTNKQYSQRVFPVIVGAMNAESTMIPWILRRFETFTLVRRGDDDEGLDRIAQVLKKAV
ncbi:MAG: toll/interleukin-1 receptor domain-containing protein [Gemmatimonadaceae bacterium]